MNPLPPPQIQAGPPDGTQAGEKAAARGGGCNGCFDPVWPFAGAR